MRTGGAADLCPIALRAQSVRFQPCGRTEVAALYAKGRGVDWQIKHLECPSCVNAGSPMPAFKTLGAENLKKLAIFLEASKGPK